MSRPTRRLTETTLRTDLNELFHQLVRELASACRKVAIYGTDHPVATRAVEQPFVCFGKIFLYRELVTMNLHRGELYVCNISVKPSIFTKQLLQYIQILDIVSLLFTRDLSAPDLMSFIAAIVNRDTQYDPSFKLSEYLRQERINTIEVNSERGFELFEQRKLYRGEVESDYAVRRLALDQIGKEPLRLARIFNATAAELLEMGVDFTPDIVAYLVPERLVAIQPEEIVRAVKSARRPGQDTAVEGKLIALAKAHPRANEILQAIAQTEPAANSEVGSDAEASPVSGETPEAVVKAMMVPVAEQSPEEFSDSFARLLNTGRINAAIDMIRQLISRLSNPEAGERQTALELLTAAIELFSPATPTEVISAMRDSVDQQLAAGKETFEYAEVIRALFVRLLRQNCWSELAELCQSLKQYRERRDGVTTVTSLAVKKALEQVNRTDLIELAIDKLVKAKGEETGQVRVVLSTIGSEDVALSLSLIISHPVRQVRQQALKILAELGDAALAVFSRMMVDEAYFRRDEERYELPDAKWYVVRNTIFVLGSLGDSRAIDALRLRINDPDVRVRREIIRSLEKIGGEMAVDLLSMMAEDASAEIREAAMISIGMIGNAEHAPLIIDLAHRHPSEAIKAISALGRLGGQDAKGYLCRLLHEAEELSRLTSGAVSRDELRAAVIRALGNIGDDTCLKTVKQYQSSLSTTQKLFLKGSPVHKALSEVLRR